LTEYSFDNIVDLITLLSNAMKRTSRSGNAVQRTAGWCEAADIRIKKSPLSRPPK